MLKSLAGPFAKIGFCPTGGVSLSNMADYLNQPNVLCVGGSWLAPAEMIKNKNWEGITSLAKEAVEAAIKSGWQKV
jgi:2-dehydro-3-deoxyphosphogluconate aldolase/(4S)-4-hydroxy-2-oxoglutarate aldolase